MPNKNFYIAQYEFLKKDVASSYIFHLEFDNKGSAYNLVIPSNPFVDIEILKLIRNTTNIKEILIQLHQIVKKNKYSNLINTELKKMLTWILNKTNSNTNNMLYE